MINPSGFSSPHKGYIIASSLAGAVLVKNVENRVLGPSPWSNSQTPAIGTAQID
jgi:hypothetical protein